MFSMLKAVAGSLVSLQVAEAGSSGNNGSFGFNLPSEALTVAYIPRPKIITRTNFLCRIKEIRIFPVQISYFFVSNFARENYNKKITH
jgi:hypothetical protein